MFERYDEKARRVIFSARDAANENHCQQIEAELLLLAILREDKELARRWLNISPDDLEAEILNQIARGSSRPTEPDLKLSNESKRVLAYGAEEANRLRSRIIGVEHLFLGLLREEHSRAERLLRNRGAHLKTLRLALAREAGLPVNPLRKQQKFSFLNIFHRKSEKIERP